MNEVNRNLAQLQAAVFPHTFGMTRPAWPMVPCRASWCPKKEGLRNRVGKGSPFRKRNGWWPAGTSHHPHSKPYLPPRSLCVNFYCNSTEYRTSFSAYAGIAGWVGDRPPFQQARDIPPFLGSFWGTYWGKKSRMVRLFTVFGFFGAHRGKNRGIHRDQQTPYRSRA